ncbi:MAG: hypothetical protein V1861_04905 [Candidatus Micrarchaeota archaeon]
MTTGVCSRCGTSGEMEYGSDGLTYCSSCAFYGLNKQCYRCRMYLPAAELQQYRGQWMCPYCVQDMRDADRKAEEPAADKGKPHLDVVSYLEQCERCGRDLESRVYIWNGKRLCKSCVNDEQEKWGLMGGGPMAAPYRISLEPEKKRKKTSIIESIISETLHLLGIKKKGMEIIVIDSKMPIKYAKPMAEKPMESGKRAGERKPETEGIMMGKKPVPAEAGKPSSAAARKESEGELSRVVPAKSQKGGKTRRARADASGKKKKQ